MCRGSWHESGAASGDESCGGCNPCRSSGLLSWHWWAGASLHLIFFPCSQAFIPLLCAPTPRARRQRRARTRGSVHTLQQHLAFVGRSERWPLPAGREGVLGSWLQRAPPVKAAQHSQVHRPDTVGWVAYSPVAFSKSGLRRCCP